MANITTFDVSLNLTYKTIDERKAVMELLHKDPSLISTIANLLTFCSKEKIELVDLIENSYRYKEQKEMLSLLKETVQSEYFSEIIKSALKNELTENRNLIIDNNEKNTIDVLQKQDQSEEFDDLNSSTVDLEKENDEEQEDEGEIYEVPLGFNQCTPIQRLRKLLSFGLYKPTVTIRVFKDGKQEVIEKPKRVKETQANKKEKLKKNKSKDDFFDEI